MVTLPFFVLIVAIALVSWFLFGANKHRHNASRLRNRYLTLLHLPREEAEAILSRQLDSVRQRFPGRSEEWYLDKLIYDLERDRY